MPEDEGLTIRAAFVAGDETYGGRELRRGIRQRGMGYVMTVISPPPPSRRNASKTPAQTWSPG